MFDKEQVGIQWQLPQWLLGGGKTHYKRLTGIHQTTIHTEKRLYAITLDHYHETIISHHTQRIVHLTLVTLVHGVRLVT